MSCRGQSLKRKRKEKKKRKTLLYKPECFLNYLEVVVSEVVKADGPFKDPCFSQDWSFKSLALLFVTLLLMTHTGWKSS